MPFVFHGILNKISFDIEKLNSNWGKEKFLSGYLGNLGIKQGLDNLFANLLKNVLNIFKTLPIFFSFFKCFLG